MRRGEVYLCDLSYGQTGHEQDGTRPAIILSNDKFNNNRSWGTVIVVPISTSPSQAQRQYGIFLPQGSGGLPRDSVALCHQITTIDRDRVQTLLGSLDAKLLGQVEAEVKIILYLP
ncbi:type II toxin-antitoxin system PemK/MazF family toxin [Candidatus Binatus sp.]|uniref:type II toxin-antitoxin system PemK/MazF family toxin n=1 Tax=Candidatus Binatus sp. TaxID=2811406 RepID=UPI00351CF995